MSRFSRILALLLVAAAIVLAVLAFSLSRHKEAPRTASVTVTAPVPAAGHPVVVAAAPLKAGEAIAATSLRIDTLPTAPEGGFDRIDALAGRIPRLAITAGTVLTADSLAQGLALQLLPGERALAIPVDEIAGVGNRIAPGDYVDVFFDLKKGQERGEETQARLLLSRMHVLAYGNNMLAPAASAYAGANGAGNQASGGTRTDPPSPRTAVLAVPVDAVDRLLLATREGKLSLALRHPDDRRTADAALFAQPATVLPTRQGLTLDERAVAAAPENQAFAGIDASGLAGRDTVTPFQPVRPVRAERGGHPTGIEIIRGAQRSRMFAPVACAGGKECAP